MTGRSSSRLLSLLALALALAGCGAGGEPQAGDAAPVALVRTAPVEAGAAAGRVLLYGLAEPGPGGERALVAPSEIVVVRVVAPNGMAVRAGESIAIVRPSPATAAAAGRAAADLAAANDAYARAKRLRADGLASDADLQAARAAAAAAARSGLGIGTGAIALRAPAAGVVAGLAARPGDQLGAGAPLATIITGGGLRARLGIDPDLARRVRPGQPLRLERVDGGRQAEARVAGIDTRADPATRLASIYAAVPPGLGLAPGEALRGWLGLVPRAEGLVIPYAALLDDGGRSYVWVVKDGVAHRRSVAPGNSAGDRIAILGGLAAGERVVTEGGTALEDGMGVREPRAGR